MKPRVADERGSLKLAVGPVWAAVRGELVVAVVLVVANLAALLALTLPAWRAASQADSAARRGELAHGALEPALARARQSFGKIIEAEDALAQLRSRVNERTGTVGEVATTLRAAVDAAGLASERIRYQPQDVPELGMTQIQVELPVRGTYRQVRRLLEELLDGPAFMVLERVALASDVSEGDQLRVALRTSVFLAEAAAAVEPPSRTEQRGAGTDAVETARQLSRRLAALPPIPVPTDDLVLDLGPLDAAPIAGSPVRRNPFAFAASERPARPAEPVEAPRIAPPPEPAAPVMPYELLGITRTDEALLATVSDGDHVHLLREGEMLPEGYRVIAIDLVSIRLDAGAEIVRLSLRREDGVERESELERTPAPKKKTKKPRGTQ